MVWGRTALVLSSPTGGVFVITIAKIGLFRKSSQSQRPSVSELVSQLDSVSISSPTPPPDRSVTPRPSSTTPLTARSNSIPKTLQSISEQPTVAANVEISRTGSDRSQGSYRQRSDEVFRQRSRGSEGDLSRKAKSSLLALQFATKLLSPFMRSKIGKQHFNPYGDRRRWAL